MWEEAEEVRCVASYPERGHLAWLTDNTPTVQRAVMSQVLMQTLPWEPERMRTGSKKSEGGRGEQRLLLSKVTFYWLVFLSDALFPVCHVGTASM